MFAAYSTEAPSTSEEKTEVKPTTWLANSSYVPPTSIQIDAPSSSDSDCKVVRVRKDRKKKKAKRKPEVKIVPKPTPKSVEIKWGFVENACAFTDRTGTTDNFAFPATYSRQTARYRLTTSRGTIVSSKRVPTRMLKVFFPPNKDAKKKKDVRYYSRIRVRNFTRTPVLHRHRRTGVTTSDAWSDTVIVHQPPQLDAEGNELVWDAGVQMFREKIPTDERDSPESQRIALLVSIMSTPTDMTLWHRLAKVLALIRTKNAFATDTADEEVRETDERRASINERLLDVVERVIKEKYATVNATPTEVVLLRMQLAVDRWPREKVETEWRQLTFHRINDVRIWRARIAQMKMGAEFTAEKVTQMYASAIEKLSLVASGRVASHKPSSTAIADLVALLVEYVEFVKATGHTERALAVAQALMEYNFYRPPNGTLAQLADWWSTGVPRFGDLGAVGWKNRSPSSTTTVPTLRHSCADLADRETLALEEIAAQRVTDDDVEQTAKCWRALEALRLTNEWTPTTGDDEENDDLDAVIAFDDIRPFVVEITGDDAPCRFVLCQMMFSLFECPMEEMHSSEASMNECDLASAPSLVPPIPTSPFVDVADRLGYVRRIGKQIVDQIYAAQPVYQTYFTCRLLGAIFATMETPMELDKVAKTALSTECATQHPLYYLMYARAIDRMKGDPMKVLKPMAGAVGQTLAAVVNGTADDLELLDVHTSLAVTNAYLLHAILHTEKPSLSAVHVAVGVYGKTKGDSMTNALRLINTMQPRFDEALARMEQDYKERPATTREHGSILLNGWLGTLTSLLNTLHVLLACACSMTSIVANMRLFDEADFHDQQLISTLPVNDARRDVLRHCIERRAVLRVRLVRRHVQLDRMATPSTLTQLLKSHPNNMWLMREYVDNVNAFDRLTVRLHFARHLDADMFIPASAAQLYGAVYAECRRYITSVDSMNLSTGRASLAHLTSTLRQVLELRPNLLDLWLLWMRIEHDSHTLRRYVRSTSMPPVESVYYLAATAAPYALCVQTLFSTYSPRHWRRTIEVIAERRLRLRCAPEEVHMLMNTLSLAYDGGRREVEDDEGGDEDDDM